MQVIKCEKIYIPRSCCRGYTTRHITSVVGRYAVIGILALVGGCNSALDPSVGLWILAGDNVPDLLNALDSGLRGNSHSQGIEDEPPGDLCHIALNSQQNDWDETPLLASYVSEVKRRGFSVANCRELDGAK